jgi:hypothetical protein
MLAVVTKTWKEEIASSWIRVVDGVVLSRVGRRLLWMICRLSLFNNFDVWRMLISHMLGLAKLLAQGLVRQTVQGKLRPWVFTTFPTQNNIIKSSKQAQASTRFDSKPFC